jgi:hypothetical protein
MRRVLIELRKPDGGRMKASPSEPRAGDQYSQWSLVVLAMFVVILVLCSAFVSNQLFIVVAFIVPTALLVWHIREYRTRQNELSNMLSHLPIPFSLAATPGFAQHYSKIADAVSGIARHRDSLFRGLALTRLEAIADELEVIAQGEIVFAATETWRAAYRHILETLHVKTYYSVAWVRTNDYWNDTPGRQSMQLNFELAGRGYRIERVHILADELWPFEENLPRTGILEWLVEQQGRGIIVSLIRESDLEKEADLLRDFAIYGDRAFGIQEMDEQARTVRFVLSFDPGGIRQALNRWERLALYAKPFGDFMDPRLS